MVCGCQRTVFGRKRSERGESIDRLGENEMNIESILKSLAAKRPIFHSEADFQYALDREIETNNPQIAVEREARVTLKNQARTCVDLLARHNGQTTFFELKYKTLAINLECEGESFSLKSHGAQDQGAYDFLKDIARIESLVETTPNSSGYAIMISNDPRYWKPGLKENPIDAEFRLLDGRILSGTLAWAKHAGNGSIKGRESAITLRHDYPIRWLQFSELNSPGKSIFRYLCLRITPLPTSSGSTVPTLITAFGNT